VWLEVFLVIRSQQVFADAEKGFVGQFNSGDRALWVNKVSVWTGLGFLLCHNNLLLCWGLGRTNDDGLTPNWRTKDSEADDSEQDEQEYLVTQDTPVTWIGLEEPPDTEQSPEQHENPEQ
jgi:hypothetical protein